MYYISLDDVTSVQMGLAVTKRPEFPAPVKTTKNTVFRAETGNFMKTWAHMKIYSLKSK